MSIAAISNFVVMVFCLAVLVQSLRLMRALKAVKGGALAQVVHALDASTTQARTVLTELKATLGECASAGHHLGRGKEMAEELAVLVGIANATADRLIEAAAEARAAPAGEPAADADEGERKQWCVA